MYCGVIGSSTSLPHGTPSSLIVRRIFRASCRPASRSQEPSSRGSFTSPFQPIVVRGFSKYVRMTTSRSSRTASVTGRSRRAYSNAASGSWIEHGPTTTRSRRVSRPCRMSRIAARVARTSAAAVSLAGCAPFTARGAMSGTMSTTFRSSSLSAMVSSSRKKKAPRAHSRGLSGCVVAVRPSRGTLPPRRRPGKEAHVERDVSLHGSMSSAVRGRRQSRRRDHVGAAIRESRRGRGGRRACGGGRPRTRPEPTRARRGHAPPTGGRRGRESAAARSG